MLTYLPATICVLLPQEQARRLRLAIMKHQSRDNIVNSSPGHTEARSAPHDPSMPTEVIEQAEPGEASRSRRKIRTRNKAGTSPTASPSEYIPLKDRDPTRCMKGLKPLPIAEASLEQPVGLPRYMSPRPLGFEEPCQVRLVVCVYICPLLLTLHPYSQESQSEISLFVTCVRGGSVGARSLDEKRNIELGW